MISKNFKGRALGASLLVLSAGMGGCAKVDTYYGSGIQETGMRSVLFPELRDTKFQYNKHAARQETVENLEASEFPEVTKLGTTVREIAPPETRERLDRASELDGALATVRSQPKAAAKPPLKKKGLTQ